MISRSFIMEPFGLHVCCGPDGNYGYGVFVEPTKDGRWCLTPAPEPEEQKERRAKRDVVRQERQEKRAARRRGESKDVLGTVLGVLKKSAREQGLKLEVVEVPDQRNDATAVTLDEVVLSKHELPDRWTVAGYWNLGGAWRVRGTDDWPFGGVEWDRGALSDQRLVACLSGSIFVPNIPTFAEIESYILALKLRVPPWECGCGAVHADGGEVVGLWIEEHDFLGKTMRDVRLIVREDGHQRFRESLVEEVLDLRICVLLKHVEPGGMKPSVRNRRHGDEAARAREDMFDRMRAESDKKNADALRGDS